MPTTTFVTDREPCTSVEQTHNFCTKILRLKITHLNIMISKLLKMKTKLATALATFRSIIPDQISDHSTMARKWDTA